MRLLDHVQRGRGLDRSVRSLTERRGDADLCDEDERKHAASRRQWTQLGHCLSSLSIVFATPSRVNASRGLDA
jgi:hypothetical protein